MAAPTTTPKIEELRFRLKTDPKNRLFYVLAEELRRISQFGEAEQVLRGGLAHHPTYLSAWVSLGRVLREQKKDGGAIEALQKALQLDPGNVVAARLLADAFLATGEKVEAIKKYKLVQALLPPDEEIEAVIARLDAELNAQAEAAAVAEPSAAERPSAPREEAPATEEPAMVPAGAPAASDSLPAPQEPAGLEQPESVAPLAEAPASPLGEEAPLGGGAAGAAAPFETPAEALPAAGAAPDLGSASPFGSPWADEETMPQPAPRAREQSYAELAPTLDSVGGTLADDSSGAGAGPPAAPDEASAVVPGLVPPAPEPWTESSGAFDSAAAALEDEQRVEATTADDEPMRSAHAESPFEEPASYTADAFEVEAPAGMHVARAPIAAEVPLIHEAVSLAPPESPAAAVPPAGEGAGDEAAGDLANTLTMADLYARQGLVSEARRIYENILQREPGNEPVRQRLSALPGEPPAGEVAEQTYEEGSVSERTAGLHAAKIARLQAWLARVGRREVSSVR